MTEVINAISTVGFPIVACLGVAVWIYKDKQQDREDALKREDRLMEELNTINKTNVEVVTTNKMLADKLTEKVDNMGNKMDSMKNSIEAKIDMLSRDIKRD